jgi:hypothetical protein
MKRICVSADVVQALLPQPDPGIPLITGDAHLLEGQVADRLHAFSARTSSFQHSDLNPERQSYLKIIQGNKFTCDLNLSLLVFSKHH